MHLVCADSGRSCHEGVGPPYLGAVLPHAEPQISAWHCSTPEVWVVSTDSRFASCWLLRAQNPPWLPRWHRWISHMHACAIAPIESARTCMHEPSHRLHPSHLLYLYLYVRLSRRVCVRASTEHARRPTGPVRVVTSWPRAFMNTSFTTRAKRAMCLIICTCIDQQHLSNLACRCECMRRTVNVVLQLDQTLRYN